MRLRTGKATVGKIALAIGTAFLAAIAERVVDDTANAANVHLDEAP